MLSSVAVQVFPKTRFLLIFATIALTAFAPKIAQAQSVSPETPQDPTGIDNQDLRPLAQGILSVSGGQQLMSEANSAISAQNYALAVDKLQQARQVFNQLSNFYQELAGSFAGIDSRIAEEHRTAAFDTAQMRDDATYQLALVHRAQDKPELAVPLLVQIVRSQNPTRDLGKKAYQQLLELGFVTTAYPRSGGEAPTP